MKVRNTVRFIVIILFILFLSLYLAQATGDYNYDKYRKTVLTENAIKNFEKDLREGKEIDMKNYIEKEKNYSNIFSSLGLKASNVLEKCFNSVMNSIFREINEVVEDDN